jgi:hypothetical protein
MRAALAPIRLANEARAATLRVRQDERRSAPTTPPHHSRPYTTLPLPGNLASTASWLLCLPYGFLCWRLEQA